MENKNHIAYYCFNKNCKASVYFSNTIKITDLPLTIATLSQEHQCSTCHSKLISMMDIELRLAVCQHEQPAINGSVLLG